jgi:uncharacterized membrane protein YeaQ/YmgE (transglycosylase-associated protein family)
MNISNDGLIVIILVGIVAGWFAGQLMHGGGFGVIGDLIVGILGAFLGDWLFPQLGIHLGVGLIAQIISAAIGAIILLFILRFVSSNRGWGGGYGVRRW